MNKEEKEMLDCWFVTLERFRLAGVVISAFDPGVSGQTESGATFDLNIAEMKWAEELIIKAYPEAADEKAMLKSRRSLERRRRAFFKKLEALTKPERSAYNYILQRRGGVTTRDIAVMVGAQLHPDWNFVKLLPWATRLCERLVKKGVLVIIKKAGEDNRYDAVVVK